MLSLLDNMHMLLVTLTCCLCSVRRRCAAAAAAVRSCGLRALSTEVGLEGSWSLRQ